MNGTEALSTIAEIAMGLAGFSGVVIVLGRQPGEFTRVEALRLGTLLGSSLGTMFFALLPLALEAAELGVESVWRFSSLLLALSILLASASVFSRRQRARQTAPEVYTSLATGLVVLISLLVFTSALANAFWVASASVYLFDLLGVLLLASLQFVRMLFVRPSE